MEDQITPAAAAQDGGAQAACLQRLATALSSYPDIEVRVRPDCPATWLAARNTVSGLSETVAITRIGDEFVFLWSWGERIGNASDADVTARSVAYVLSATGARLGR